MDNKKIFAENLKRFMRQNGKSRRDVCEAIGVSYYTFSDWCNGKKFPRMDKVELLANYFGVLKSDLIEEKKAQPAESGEPSENMKLLIEFVRSIPEEKAALALRLLKSIAEAD